MRSTEASIWLKSKATQKIATDRPHLHLASSTFHCTPAVFHDSVSAVFSHTFPKEKFLPLMVLSRRDSCLHRPASGSHCNLVSFQGPATFFFPRIFLMETVPLWKVLSILGLAHTQSPVVDQRVPREDSAFQQNAATARYENAYWPEHHSVTACPHTQHFNIDLSIELFFCWV